MQTARSGLAATGIALSVVLVLFLFSPIFVFAGGDGGGGGSSGSTGTSAASDDGATPGSNKGGGDSSGSWYGSGSNTNSGNCYYQSGGGDTGQVLVCSATTHYACSNNQCTAVGANVLGRGLFSSLASCVSACTPATPPTGTCTNGATNYPTCTFTTQTCSNGATNYPTCTFPTQTCSNGATNYPVCTFLTLSCSNGATNYPTCTLGSTGGGGGGSCSNGATDYPTCSTCTSGQALTNGLCEAICVPQLICNSSKTEILNTCTGVVANCAANEAYCDTSSGAPTCTPFPVTFVSFRAVSLSTGGSTPFDATGNLEASPELVRAGNQSQLFWNVEYAQSCAVTRSGTSGTISSAFSSGSSGLVVPDITGQTIFTLHCVAHTGATPPYIDETATVNVAPTYNVH